MAIDLEAHANRAINIALDIIAQKVGGISTARVSLTPTGGIQVAAPWAILAVIGLIGLGAFLILKK